MKLITKTSVYYALLSLTLFVAGGLIFYFSLKKIMYEEIHERLTIEKDKLIRYIEEKQELPPPSPLTDDLLIIVSTNQAVKEEIKDTLLLSPLKDEMLPYRQLIFPVKVEEKDFAVTISKPLLESADLIETIIISLGSIALLLLLLLFITGHWLSRRIWKPFYNTLNQLQGYNPDKSGSIVFTPSSTKEFSRLNDTLEKMTDKIGQQYRTMKQFSENASHEMQTPLAAVISRLELMLQSEQLTQEQINELHEVYQSAVRLSKLNQSLLLLSKIENRQFHDVQSISIKELIESKLSVFEEMINFKNLTVEKRFDNEISVKMDPLLADVLMSNIVGNAVKHNLQDGSIAFHVGNQFLSVSNTGHPLTTPSEKLFERFVKDSASPDSIGLGLSIVKQICDTYLYKADYSFTSGVHTITIRF